MHPSVPHSVTGQGGFQRRAGRNPPNRLVSCRPRSWFPSASGSMWKGVWALQVGEGRERIQGQTWIGRSQGCGGPFPPTAPSRQPPLRRWKFARLISSSHPHTLVASCLPRCRSAACLIRAPSLPRALSPDCARYVAPSVTVPVVCLCSAAPPVSKEPRSVRHLAHTTRVRLHEHVWPQQRGNDPPHVVRGRG